VLNSIFPLVTLDVRNSDSIQAAVAKIIASSGRLDIVINNAGVGITGPLEEIPSEEIKNNFETNLFGPIEVMKAALPQMRTQKSGLIINITSIAGYMGLPYRSIYSASKGLELITEALRMEVKSFGIHITNVAPGDFATNIASGRYHAPVIKGSLMRFLMESHCERWMSMSMEVVIQMKWLKLFIKLFKLKNLEYIIK
jgi:NAD(P)-dependent dehydrogenase (short-subunit alcohol dehydrogenase family)